MGESIISVRKGLNAKESFFGGPQRSRRQQGQGRGKGIGRGGKWEQGGRTVYPTKRGMRISASSKGGPRRRWISIFQRNERENRSKE